MQPPILWVVEAELFIPPSFSILKNLSQTMEWEGQLDPCVDCHTSSDLYFLG